MDETVDKETILASLIETWYSVRHRRNLLPSTQVNVIHRKLLVEIALENIPKCYYKKLVRTTKKSKNSKFTCALEPVSKMISLISFY